MWLKNSQNLNRFNSTNKINNYIKGGREETKRKKSGSIYKACQIKSKYMNNKCFLKSLLSMSLP